MGTSSTEVAKLTAAGLAIGLGAIGPSIGIGIAVRGALGSGVTYVGRRALPYGQESGWIFTVDASATLAWTDSGAATYTVNLGTTNPPAQVATGLTSASYQPASLVAATT